MGSGSAGAAGGPGARLLLLFTRYPEAGRVKTRLIPALGAAGAAELQRAMTERTLARVGGRGRPWNLEVRYDGGDEARMRIWLGPGVRCVPQGAGELGERLRRSFEDGFARGCAAVVAVGSDCPELGAGDVAAACDALESSDAVFGPAVDGGYFLVGLRRGAWPAAAALFEEIPWGGAAVLAASEGAAARVGCVTARLRTLADVDRPGDLPEWEQACREDAAGDSLTVVVPTLGEASGIASLVDDLRRVARPEVIVADGGSADGTPEIAAGRGARVIGAPRGRAAQLNAGAAAAAGELLVFVHADTRLPRGWPEAVRRTLADRGVAAGTFSLAIDSRRRSLRAIEALANWRARRLGISFGDQALFVRRAVFEAAGRFPEQPLLEDYELVRRLRRLGRVVVLPQRAVTSARRWERRGTWRTSLRNVAITLAYLGGVSPRRLAGWYR